MLLNIARHMFMHTYLFFSFLFFVFGCDVFSLSLSLFSLFHIKCAMAPKPHKSTLGWNPLQGSGSSSFDPIPLLHIWFHDKKARKDFSKNFQKRGVHPKHHVILSDFSNTPLPVVIRT